MWLKTTKMMEIGRILKLTQAVLPSEVCSKGTCSSAEKGRWWCNITWCLVVGASFCRMIS
jgi:hypothetical protein